MKKITCLSLVIMSILWVIAPTANMSSYAVNVPQPPTNMTVEFKVYPDGTVELAGDFFSNYTYGSMYYTGPTSIHSEVEAMKEGGFFILETNNTVTFSKEQASQFPLNSTAVNITEEYSEENLNIKIKGSVVFPDEWSGYRPRIYINFNSFPFNSTDLIIRGQYYEETYNGSLIIHLIPGLALGDIEINVKGNATHLIISDSIKVFYNYTLPVPGFTPLNRTKVEEIIRSKYYIDQMLNSMTGGLITCQSYNVTVIQNDENSDTIYLEIVLHGDFINVLTKIYESIITQVFLQGYYYYLPPEARKVISNIFHDLANIIIKSVKEGNFELTYTSSTKKVDFTVSSSINLKKMWNMTAQTIADDFPLEVQPYIKEFFETKYASVKSYVETITYENGRIEHTGKYILEGDLSAEINMIKELLIGLMVKTSPYPPPWQVDFINETKIIDISNLKFNFDESFKQNAQIVSYSFKGVRIAPPIDPINATCFKLRRFFNLTYNPYYEPPVKLIVKGESNGTHTVIPVIDPNDPESVPEPDEILAGNTFVWNNQSISKLKGLMFRVYEGFAQYLDQDHVSPGNPYIIDATSTANCEVRVNEVQNNVIIIVRNITLPEDVNPPPETYRVLGSYVQITSEPEEARGNFTIKMYYNPQQLVKLGIDESSLRIFYWNSTKHEWIPVETYLNTEEHYVWANVDHLSIWVVLGEASRPLWSETWFLAVISCIIIALVIVTVLLVRKRKSLTET